MRNNPAVRVFNLSVFYLRSLTNLAFSLFTNNYKRHQPKITLIISTYNNPSALDRILFRLEKGFDVPEQIIISDDGSTAETRELVDRWIAKGSLNIQHFWQNDLGFRKNRILNICLREATGEYVVFLDGDCLPTREFIKDHRRLAERGFFVQGNRAHIKASEVPGILNQQTDIWSLFWKGGLYDIARNLRLPAPVIERNQDQYRVMGCNLAVWRDDLFDINGFDEWYEGWGVGEDQDLCARLVNKGCHKKHVYGRAIVFHLDHPLLSRDHLPESMRRLRSTIHSGKVACEQGISQSVSPTGSDVTAG